MLWRGWENRWTAICNIHSNSAIYLHSSDTDSIFIWIKSWCELLNATQLQDNAIQKQRSSEWVSYFQQTGNRGFVSIPCPESVHTKLNLVVFFFWFYFMLPLMWVTLHLLRHTRNKYANHRVKQLYKMRHRYLFMLAVSVCISLVSQMLFHLLQNIAAVWVIIIIEPFPHLFWGNVAF